MDDIKVISDIKIYTDLQHFPLTLDRIQATAYHCITIEDRCFNGKLQEAKWHLRSALSEFGSMFDALNKDAKKNNFPGLSEKISSINSPLIKILKQARNLAVHTSTIKCNQYPFYYWDCHRAEVKSFDIIFIDPVRKEDFKDPRKKSKEKDNITAEEIDWFNRQTDHWPSHFIINEALSSMYYALKTLRPNR